MSLLKPLAVYVHIPFCVRKCAYCDFLSFPGTGDVQEQYMEKLLWEIQENAGRYQDYEIRSVFIGGGTPSVVKADHIARIMGLLRSKYAFHGEAECTIECNPGTVDREKLTLYRASGINRISIGCQSVHERELKQLGRIHSYPQFLETFRSAREAGFDNINVDLMSGLPGQSEEDWQQCLRTIAGLGPEHISAYSLIIEEGTPFYERYHRQVELREKGREPEEIRRILLESDSEKNKETELLPSEETEREMYHLTGKVLSEYGYGRYELSNYAKQGKECRHNMVYWQRGDYAGFGLGAASCVSGRRWKNETDLQRYLNGDQAAKMITEREKLAPEECRSEAMFLGLRLTGGIDIAAFAKRYGRMPEECYGEHILRMKQEGLLEEKNGTLRLTERGLDLANVVMGGFV